MLHIKERSNVMGGDFWDYSTYEGKRGNSLEWIFSYGSDRRFLASGRTALDHIIKDILAHTQFRSVYMPSYCCHTMIVPFFENNIKVVFYEVELSIDGGFNYKVDYDIDCEVFLIMGYFGFYSEEVRRSIWEFKKRGKIVIEDVTHSLFSDEAFALNQTISMLV